MLLPHETKLSCVCTGIYIYTIRLPLIISFWVGSGYFYLFYIKWTLWVCIFHMFIYLVVMRIDLKLYFTPLMPAIQFFLYIPNSKSYTFNLYKIQYCQNNVYKLVYVVIFKSTHPHHKFCQYLKWIFWVDIGSILSCLNKRTFRKVQFRNVVEKIMVGIIRFYKYFRTVVLSLLEMIDHF